MPSTVIRIAQSLFLTAAFTLSSILAAPSDSSTVPSSVNDICGGNGTVAYETYLGDEQDIKVTGFSCANGIVGGNTDSGNSTVNSVNICNAPCKTNCFGPQWGGNGPDPNDCQKISDKLANDPQNIFNITMAVPIVQMSSGSCYMVMVNKGPDDLQYCRKDLGGVIHYVAFNCQAPQNAHGGRCDAASDSWFVEVYHS